MYYNYLITVTIVLARVISSAMQTDQECSLAILGKKLVAAGFFVIRINPV